MSNQLWQALGGLGVFLLAMLVMTEGLRELAGDALHAWLRRFTRSPLTGAITGTGVTAFLQSSSATIVTTVGFVAAGLLTFSQALGIVLGANVGTTLTGWLVAIFGFKLKIGLIALPLVTLGMLLRIFARGRWSALGKTLAGFALLFVGIAYMQEGMADLAGAVTPDSFPGDDWSGRIVLVGIGALITLLTQSSSAGVAITMTALSVGAVNISQAACLVIGMDVGTTVTAVLASLGSSAAARRTGFSHTVYNVFSAVGALLILTPYLWFVGLLWPQAVSHQAEFVLVGFHTLFNVLALVIGLPLAAPFARLMTKLVPERDTGLARRLDERLLAEPAAARAALDASLQDAYDYLLEAVCCRLRDGSLPQRFPWSQVRGDLRDMRDFLDEINRRDDEQHREEITNAIHALDHLRRMYFRLEQRDRIDTLRESSSLSGASVELGSLCQDIRRGFEHGVEAGVLDRAAELAARLHEDIQPARERTVTRAVSRELSVAQTSQRLAAQRWLERMAHHVWRLAAHRGGHEPEDIEEEIQVVQQL